MHRSSRSFIWFTTVLTGIALPALSFGQAADPQAQNKLLARRAAEADCYRKMAETVYGVRLNSSTTVRDFVAESDQIQADVDAFIKGVRLGQPRYYDDGACEVDGEVDVQKLITKLTETHQTHYKGRTIVQTDIQKIQQILQTDVIRVTGSGAPRPELPPELPAGVETIITPLPTGYVPPPATMSVPGIWKTVPPQGRLMAERAARLDAMRKLLEEIKGLRLNSNTLVRDFVTEVDEIAADANGIVVGAAEVGKYLHDDELIVEVTMEATVEKVFSKITELHKEHYRGSHVTVTDINNVQQTLQQKTIRATGSGVPPAKFMAQIQPPAPPPGQPGRPGASTSPSTPTWFADRLETTGNGADPDINTAQGKLRAARNAHADAMRKLTEQVYSLKLDNGRSVQDFVSQHAEVRAQVDGVISSAVAAEATFSGQTAVVSVSVPAAEVWSTLRDYMVVIQHRG